MAAPVINVVKPNSIRLKELEIKRALVRDDLTIAAIGNNAILFLQLEVFFLAEFSETPFGRHKHFLSTREFVLGTAKRLQAMRLVRFFGTNR